MQPENAAMQSNFAGYSNGVVGSDAFMDEALKNAPEVVPLADANIQFALTCPPKYNDLATRL